jgi:hypothetical protein
VHLSIKHWYKKAYKEQTVLVMLLFFGQSISHHCNDRIDKALQAIKAQIDKLFINLLESLMLMKYWLNIDQAIGDVPDAQENEEVYHNEPKYLWINDFADDSEAIIETLFSKAELWN